MKTKTRNNPFFILIVGMLGMLATAHAQRGPQDSWYLDKESLVDTIPGFNKPTGIEFAPNGDAYVSDLGNDRISVWATDGSFRFAFGKHGTADGDIRNPFDISIGDGEVYVCDWDNHRIQVFDLQGNFLRKWGVQGSGNGQFHNPYATALDFNDTSVSEVFVTDHHRHRVQVFDKNGVFLRAFGTAGNGNGQLYYPTGIAIGPDSLLYVANLHGQRIKVFDKNGTEVRQITTPGYPHGVAFSGDKLAVAISHQHKVYLFDKNGTLETTLGNGSANNTPGLFNYPYGLDFDASGNLYVADRDNQRIQVFDQNRTYQANFGHYGSRNVQMHDIQSTPEKTFIITDIDGDRVMEIDENASLIRVIASNGNSDGKVTDPKYLTMGNSNRIHVSDSGNHRIQIFDRNGTFLLGFGSSGSGNGQFNQPHGITISPDGEIFVADRHNHRIQVFDANGNFLRKFGSQGNLEGQFNQPIDLDFDDNGNLIVLSHGNNRVIYLTPAGQYLRHWSCSGGSQYLRDLNNGLVGIAWSHYVAVYEHTGTRLKYWNKGSGTPSPFTSLPDGTLAIADRGNDKLRFYRPTFRTVRTDTSKDIPFPEVISVTQRAGTNYLDITYRVIDNDSSHVQTALLAFVDGGNDLSKVIVPQTFVGSTVGKLDGNVTTNQNHTVTWNAGADWNVGFGELEMAVLAKDDRDLLNLHFLTLPSTESNSTQLKINRSPILDSDLLNLWYWQLATDDPEIVHSNADSVISKPLDSNQSGGFSPSSIGSLVLWLDANDSQNITVNSNNVVTSWGDKSGNERNATLESGSPQFSPNGGPLGMPHVQFRRASGEDFLKVGGPSFFAKHMIYVCRSPYPTWNYYGGILGHQSGRNSNYLFQHGNKGFHSNRYPAAVMKNGSDLSSTNAFDLSPLDQFMILEIVVDDQSSSNKSTYRVGRCDHYSMDFDVVEILAFSERLGAEREDLLHYLSNKTGIGVSGLSLARGNQTTPLGRDYLLSKMNLRVATSAEVTRAKEGSVPGNVNQFNPTFKVGPDERPAKVNEYGFDTGANSGFWVVPN
jgi:sugar lactone lactonase YvrE